MSAKSILEADGKAILNYHLNRAPVIKPSPLPSPAKHNPPARLASLHFPKDANVDDVLNQAEATYPWLLLPGAKFVAKPDQLIKRRGKSGLLALNKTWAEAKAWVAERAGKEQQVEHTTGVLRQFLVEPFVPHPQDTEYYININSVRDVSRPLFGTGRGVLDGPCRGGDGAGAATFFFVLSPMHRKRSPSLVCVHTAGARADRRGPRATGFSSRTRAAWTLATSTPRQRSC